MDPLILFILMNLYSLVEYRSKYNLQLLIQQVQKQIMDVKKMAAMWQQRKTLQQPKLSVKPLPQKKFDSVFQTKQQKQPQVVLPKTNTIKQYTFNLNRPKQIIPNNLVKDVPIKQNPKSDPAILSKQIKPNTLQNKQTKQQGKIDFKSLKNKFQHMPLPAFQQKLKPASIVKINEKHSEAIGGQNQIIKKQNQQKNQKFQVQTQSRQLSFQQKRKMAQQMLMKSHMSIPHKQEQKQDKQDGGHGLQEKVHNHENHGQNNQQMKNSQNIILPQQTYHYRQERNNQNQLSNKLFKEALNQKQQQEHITLNNDTNRITLDTRKTKVKKRRNDNQDFDDL